MVNSEYTPPKINDNTCKEAFPKRKLIWTNLSISDAMLVSGRGCTGWIFSRLAERVAFAQQSKEKEFQDPAPKECQCETSVATISVGYGILWRIFFFDRISETPMQEKGIMKFLVFFVAGSNNANLW